MLRDVVVHLTGSSEDAMRLAYAAGLAAAFDAHLTGLQVHVLPEILSITDPSGSAFLRELIDQSNKEADTVSARLTERLSALGSHAELRRLDLFPGEIGPALAAEARTADLFVGTRPYGDPTKSAHIEEAVLFGSGRASIFLPPAFSAPAKFEYVFVGWKSSREAAHAVAEALPILRRAQHVVVGLVEEGKASRQYGSEPGADIGRFLSRHDVRAEVRMINGWTDSGAALLDNAKGTGADLIVMGGYGHSRVGELVFGGVTRHVLSSATIPVLLAH